MDKERAKYRKQIEKALKPSKIELKIKRELDNMRYMDFNFRTNDVRFRKKYKIRNHPMIPDGTYECIFRKVK